MTKLSVVDLEYVVMANDVSRAGARSGWVRRSSSTNGGKPEEAGGSGIRDFRLARSKASVCWQALSRRKQRETGFIPTLLANEMSKLKKDLQNGTDVHEAVVHFWKRFERGLENQKNVFVPVPDESLYQAVMKFAATVRRAARYRESSAAWLTCKHAVAYFMEDLSEAASVAGARPPSAAEGISLATATDEVRHQCERWLSSQDRGTIREHRDELLKRFKLARCKNMRLGIEAFRLIKRFAASSGDMKDEAAYGRLLRKLESDVTCLYFQECGMEKEKAQAKVNGLEKVLAE